MGRIVDSALELIGETPLIRLSRVAPRGAAVVWGKLESANPGGSVKDRIARAMIEQAEEAGLLKPGATIVEPTSGNTGIGLAVVCAVKGYRLVLTMPDDMNLERRTLLALYGAELVLTPALEGMTGAVFAAEQLVKERGYFMPQQFINPANPEIPRRTTAREILAALGPRGLALDAFVAGVGTGGTITGVGEGIKAERPEIRVVAVEHRRRLRARHPQPRGDRPGHPGRRRGRLRDGPAGRARGGAADRHVLGCERLGGLPRRRGARPGRQRRHDPGRHRRALPQPGAELPLMASVSVYIPTPMRRLTGGLAHVDVDVRS